MNFLLISCCSTVAPQSTLAEMEEGGILKGPDPNPKGKSSDTYLNFPGHQIEMVQVFEVSCWQTNENKAKPPSSSQCWNTGHWTWRRPADRPSFTPSSPASTARIASSLFLLSDAWQENTAHRTAHVLSLTLSLSCTALFNLPGNILDCVLKKEDFTVAVKWFYT